MTNAERAARVLAALDELYAAVWYFPVGGPRFNADQNRRFFASLVPELPEGSRLLEVGCSASMGFRGVLLAYGVEWHGVDVVAIPGLGDRFRLVVDDRIPHPDASFDAVALIDVLEHFRRPDAMIREIARVVRPGGLVFGTGAFWQFEHESYCHFSVKGVRALFEEHGFVLEEVTPSIHSGLMLAAQRFLGGGRIHRGMGRRALVRSVLLGLANAPVFYAATVLETLRKKLPWSEYRGRDEVDCASVYFKVRRPG